MWVGNTHFDDFAVVLGEGIFVGALKGVVNNKPRPPPGLGDLSNASTEWLSLVILVRLPLLAAGVPIDKHNTVTPDIGP